MRRTSASAVVMIGALALVTLLSGCRPAPSSAPIATASPPAAATPVATPDPTPTPTADPAMPNLDGKELVTITGRAAAPNGSLLDLTMVVYYPVTPDSAQGRAIAAYLAFAGDTSSVADRAFIASHGAVYQAIAVDAVPAGGPAWPVDQGVTPRFGTGLAETTVGLPLSRLEFNRRSFTAPGDGWAIAAIYNQDGSPTSPEHWADRLGSYGFEQLTVGSAVTGCSIVKTPLALSSAAFVNWFDSSCSVDQGD